MMKISRLLITVPVVYLQQRNSHWRRSKGLKTQLTNILKSEHFKNAFIY